MIGFLAALAINLAITIGLNVLSRLLEPGKKRPRPRPFESPTASSGTPLGKGFGIYEAQASVVLVKDPAPQVTEEDTDQGKVFVTRYYAKLKLMFGWGPIQMLWDIVSDERSIRTQKPGGLQSIQGLDQNIIYPELPFDFSSVTYAGVEFSINARQMYGGAQEEGGIQGLFMVYPGHQNQPVDPLTQEVDGDYASGYPWGVYARLGAESTREEGLSVDGLNQQGDEFYFVANTPTPKPIGFILGAYPDALLGDGGRIGLDANPIEILYEILVDTKWGMRKDPARIDVPQWTAKAAEWAALGFGISVPPDDPRSADDLFDDILSHIDGGIVEDPITGLLQIKLARSNYSVGSLLTVNKSNTNGMTRGKPLAPKSLNDIQVRYRRFHGGVAGTVENEFATRDLDWNMWLPGIARVYLYRSAGDNLDPESIHVYVDDVEVPVNTTFVYEEGDVVVMNPKTGIWWFIGQSGGPIQEGVEIRISYVSSPSFVAFVDDVAVAQNLASQQARQHQPESYDYTFYTNSVAAQWKADRLRSTLSRVLDTFTWEGARDQSHLTPWDVVALLEPEWGITDPIPIRITKVSGGTRTNPRLVFEGVRDVWGEPVRMTGMTPAPPNTPALSTAPAMGIGCGIGGVDVSRTDLFPTDFIYAVEVYEADDETGTGSTLVATIPAGTNPMFYDGMVGKYYAARQISVYTRPGPFTPWITCEDIDDPPVNPTCILPTWTAEADDAIGTIILTILDPQNRVQLVEFRNRSDGKEWSAWWTSLEAPHCEAVVLHATLPSRIEWRITYLGCNGVPTAVIDGYDFIPDVPGPPEPPGTPGLTSLEIEVALHAGGPTPVGVAMIADPLEPFTPWKSAQVKTPMMQAKSCYLAASVLQSDLPEGSYLGLQGELPGEPGNWQFLDGATGPNIPLHHLWLLGSDEEALGTTGTLPATVRGDWVEIREEFLAGPLHIRGVVTFADGTTEEIALVTRFSAWFSIQSQVSSTPDEPPETDEPFPEDPGSCDVPTDVPLEPPTEEPDPCDEAGSWHHPTGAFGRGTGVTAYGWIADTTSWSDWRVDDRIQVGILPGETGDEARYLRLWIIGSGTGGSITRIRRTISGFTPGVTYKTKIQQVASAVGSTVTMGTGGPMAVTILPWERTANGSGNLEIGLECRLNGSGSFFLMNYTVWWNFDFSVVPEGCP